MCGIFGIIDSRKEVATDLIGRMADRLAHRGPDDRGIWVSPDRRVGLAHRRLSIIDLSSTGHQPMLDASARYAMVFNGEVYNYIELRNELEGLGHHFKGAGDSEVVLAAYAEWGEACLPRFNGMFAFAIYDGGTTTTNPSIFFARDRVGKKPLYFSLNGSGIAFASELKAIPESMRGGLSLDALNFYLALGYIPDARCILEGVSKLPPAHAARYVIDSGEFKQWRWWSLPALEPAADADVNELMSQVESLMHDAVRLRLRSDVPVGVLLSGGLDSSLVVASAAHAATRVKTFTIGFPGSRLDETGYASLVARHFGTDHHVLALPDSSLSALEEFASVVDEPLADSSLIPAYLVSKMTAGQVKVALGGDGGDELFGGYGDYTMAMRDARRLAWLPPVALKKLALAAGSLPVGVRGRNRLYALRGGAYQSLVWGSPYFDAPARRRILSPDAVEQLGDRFMAPEMFRLGLFEQGCDPIDSMTRTHFGSILPDDFLVKVDRASMAVGLEARCPFLDYRLIEFAFGRLPSEWKVVEGEGRRLQKRLARKLLPPELNVERKQGFSIPLNEWLRSDDAHRISGINNMLPRYFDKSEIRRLGEGHANGRANGSRLFALIMFHIASQNLGLAS